MKLCKYLEKIKKQKGECQESGRSEEVWTKEVKALKILNRGQRKANRKYKDSEARMYMVGLRNGKTKTKTKTIQGNKK